jgi:hypothetical protein
MSGQHREPALDRRDRVRLAISRSRAAGAGGDVEPDCQRGGRERLGTLTTGPARKLLPVGGVGPLRVGRARGLKIVADPLGEAFEMRGQRR